jgi:LmbE family N-acetylglucosaminyl deacetylase
VKVTELQLPGPPPFMIAAARPRILAVLAHPDDESFGMGGTLALYASRGAAVYLICATRGEAGDIAEHYLMGYSSKSERREAELRCAATTLGLSGVYMLPYRDSGMPGAPDNQHPRALAAAPMDEVVAQVVYHIRLLRPHIVLTFDPIGGYRHPDHLAIQHATVKAFDVAGDPLAFPGDIVPYQPCKLYFHTFPHGFLRFMVWIMPLLGKDPRRFGRNHDIDLTTLAVEDFPTQARIDFRSVYARKIAAGRCHASQGGGSGLIRDMLSWWFRITGSSYQDNFMRAYPPPTAGLLEDDIFQGIDMDSRE